MRGAALVPHEDRAADGALLAREALEWRGLLPQKHQTFETG